MADQDKHLKLAFISARLGSASEGMQNKWCNSIGKSN